mmetsp:Transcript_10128/g.13390  ORF Transcript_10128/g.13390 Transcript_10128/m.13390 type:complete len:318 (+) Transcript_10128:692-1645(+)
MLSQKVREPEEEHIIGKLEETEGKSVLGDHRNLESTHVRNGLGALVFVHAFSLFGEFLSLGFHLFLTNLDFGCDNSNIQWISNELRSQKGPSDVAKSGDGQGPPIRHFQGQNQRGAKSSSDITQVLMASPETKDGTAVLDGFRVAKPVTHDGRTDGSTGRLEETKKKVDGINKSDTKGITDSFKVKPNGNIDQQQTKARSEKTNCQNDRWIKGITKLSVNDVTSSISGHKNSVHLRQDQRAVMGKILQRSLHCRVTLAREMRHEITAKGDEKGPWLVGLEATEMFSVFAASDKRLGFAHGRFFFLISKGIGYSRCKN